jgi:ATP-dependent DNA ligase
VLAGDSVDAARKSEMWAVNTLLLVPALMRPTLLPRPFHHEGWVYEEKVDGYRMVVYKDDDGVRL